MTEPEPLIPPIGALPQAERLFRVNWVGNLERSPSGMPLHTPEYVALQGPGVRIIDVREEEELVGPLGYIPGSDWIPRERALSLSERLPALTPVVLVSRAGERGSGLAGELEHRGMRMVASMRGGMVAWRAMGFAATRDPAILERRDVLREPTPTITREPGPLAAGEIEQHIGDPRSTRWIKLAAILLHGRQACVDGRDDSGVIGTPGGDAGELLLGIAALERVTGRALPARAIDELLRRRLDAFGRFYMHSDVGASNALIASMRADARLTEAIGTTYEPLEWRRWISAPPVQARAAVLEHLCSPAHIGCGHLRLMLQNADQYAVRPGLVLDVLSAFFHTRWSGAAEIEQVVLPGGHSEGAVVNVRVDGTLHPHTWVPLVSPSCAGSQMFVNHPQVSAYLRRELAAFLAEQTDLLGGASVDAPTLCRTIDELAARQMSATLGYLAKGLPIYDLVLSRTGTARVTPAGAVAP
jgi:rhodanese-related sulfurtransferase